MNEPKQVIVVRKDLNMRKGKIAAQVAHASMAVILNMIDWRDEGECSGMDFQGVYSCEMSLDTEHSNDKAIYEWLTGKFAKICVYVNSEEELLEIHSRAKSAGLPTALIIDEGRTEFHGVKTPTTVAVGPAWKDEVDEITGGLNLL